MAKLSAEGRELTHSQMQIWTGQRLHPDNPLYNMAFAFVFPAVLRADLFCAAWRRVADSSDALRTRVEESEGGGVAWHLATGGSPTTVLDFAAQPDPQQAFHHWCQQRAARPLPLAGPLVDSVLVRLGADRTGWYLNQHHLIADAWSTRLLYEQVAAHYQALLCDAGDEPPPLADFYGTAAAVRARADRWSRAEREKACGHWAARQQRAGRVAALYGRRGAPIGTTSRRWTLELDEVRSRALDQLCGQEGFRSLSAELSRFSLFATLLVSWLHRVTGSSDLGFDAPVSGRPSADAKRALGLFIEMFPFAVRVGAQASFRSLAARCLEEAGRFLRFALPGLSAPSGATASNVVLNYVAVAFGPFAGMPAAVEWVHPGHGDSVHALRLQVHDFSGAGRYVLHFDINEGALPRRLQGRCGAHFEKILAAMLDDPDRPIATVDLRTASEQQALAALNTTDAAPLPARSAVATFLAQAAREPERVALRQEGQELTFAALGEQSAALAATLVAQGVAPGDRVAIVSRRSPLAVIAMLGAWRARAAYLPIEVAVPPGRLDVMLEDAGCRLVLAGEGVEPVIRVPGVAVLKIAAGIRAGDGATLSASGPQLDDLAYVLYTSGSTGRPKGVLIDHGGLADYLSWAERQYVRGDRLTFPLFTSLAVDLTVTSLFLPLITGGTLEIYPESGGPVDTAVMDVVQADAVDFIKLTPSHLSLLEQLGLTGSRIRRMVVGGENLRTPLAAAISAQFQDRIEIYNEYGPTEAVVGCLLHRYDPAVDTDASVPIGVPADHVRIEILNDALAPVPEGVPGELWIARHGLARGYQGLAGLGAERFLPQPDSEEPGARRYRTGDLVRMDDGGKLVYLGRRDRQLKVAGFRVEPGEIESALASLPQVEQCIVIARRHVAVASAAHREVHHCTRCGLPANYPRVTFDGAGVCSVCQTYAAIREHARAYFRTLDDLAAVFAASAQKNEPRYDCMMLLSGGKDSTYALCRLVDMGLAVYAFTLDNGFIAEGAKENIRQVTAQLGVPVELGSTPAMNAIFRDSLMCFANVCNGCFKTIYTLSTQRAHELGIPIIVTGLSRGQMFETRLTEEMFRDGRRSAEEVDAAVLAARKAYHRVTDEVSRSLDVKIFQDDRIFEQVQFVDFYRYCDVDMDEMYAYLRQRVPWIRPKDTGRSTNCLINDAGIYVHKKERGFHNYALPYSWDVRLGHKSRQAALDELDDDIDVARVRQILAQVGYDDEAGVTSSASQTILEAFYVASETIPEQHLRRHLSARLPSHLIPVHLQQIDSIPLASSGKVDERALAREASRQPDTLYRAPEGPVEEYLAAVWQEELWAERVGADDHFFQLGGTSLAAIQVTLRLCQEFDIELPLDSLFAHPTLGELARVAEDRILADVEAMSDADLDLDALA